MEKIDRLGWAAGLTFSAYGLRFGVRVSDAAALGLVVPCLPPGSKLMRFREVDFLYSWVVGGATSSRTRRFHLLYGDAVRRVRTHEPADILESLQSDLQLRVGEFARRRVFLHAGVVAWQGRALVIPGSSRSGKSTLVEALVRQGATYYSDEFGVMDSRARVHPYAKPIFIRQAGGGRQEVTAEELGGASGRQPLPVAAVLLCRYRRGTRPRLRRCSPGQAILELLKHAVSARRKPQVVLTTLRKLAETAPVYEGVRGEAVTTARALLDVLGNPSPDLEKGLTCIPNVLNEVC